MMNMYFRSLVDMKNVLFEGLNINSARDMVFLGLVSFLLTVIFEALVAAKAVVGAKRKMNPLAGSQRISEQMHYPSLSSEGTSSQADLLSSLRIPTNVGVVHRHKLKLFALESLMHTFKFAYGYMLMLLVMTYCVWLMVAVVLGSGVGYFFFHPLTTRLSQVYSSSSATSHGACCDDREDGEDTRGGVMNPPSVNIETSRLWKKVKRYLLTDTSSTNQTTGTCDITDSRLELERK